VLIRGHISSPIPIRCSIRQGFPLSMQLLAPLLNPLLCIPDARLPGIKIGRSSKKTTMIGYARDVTILVTSSADKHQIRQALRSYQAASGANFKLSKIEGFGDRFVGYINRHNGHTISYCHNDPRCPDAQHSLTIHEQHLVCGDRKDTRTGRDECSTNLGIDQRILYVHNFLLAREWHTAQAFPPPEECVWQIHA
jgi:hypothetical protein